MLADWYRSQGRPVRSHGNSTAESWAAISPRSNSGSGSCRKA